MSLYSEYLKRCPELLECLENARNAGRLTHSFLIHAPDDRTRAEFAIVLEQLAGCLNPVNGRPDTTCPFCRQIENGSYSDLHKISPVGKMYQIRVGDRANPEPNTLRDMLDHLGYTAGKHRKFGVIIDADRMGVEAQNALLKTLEEPPPETTLILCTANPSALLPTTRSRCQTLSLPDNLCRFDFAGVQDAASAVFDLCFNCRNDLCRTEETLQRLLNVMSALADSAEEWAKIEFQDQIAAAANSEDAAFIKQLEARISDAANGEYIRQRRRFIAFITTFCSQLFMLSHGVSPADLPNPDIFNNLTIPLNIPPERGEAVLKEAEELERTLRFNVSDELALRTFAVNLSMR